MSDVKFKGQCMGCGSMVLTDSNCSCGDGRVDTLKFKAGDVLMAPSGDTWVLDDKDAENFNKWPDTMGGWRLKERPAERQLAPGWVVGGAYACTFGDSTDHLAKYGRHREGVLRNDGACEEHATEMGVFAAAPKVDVKQSAPVCKEWCGLPYFDERVPLDASVVKGKGLDVPGFCAAACLDAGRPLNPAPAEPPSNAHTPSWDKARRQAAADRIWRRDQEEERNRLASTEAARAVEKLAALPEYKRIVGKYGDDGSVRPGTLRQWQSLQFGRATGIDRERTGPTRTEVEWRKLPARCRQSIGPDEDVG